MTPDTILDQPVVEGQPVGGAVPEDQQGLDRLIEALNIFHEEHGLLSGDHPIL